MFGSRWKEGVEQTGEIMSPQVAGGGVTPASPAWLSLTGKVPYFFPAVGSGGAIQTGAATHLEPIGTAEGAVVTRGSASKLPVVI